MGHLFRLFEEELPFKVPCSLEIQGENVHIVRNVLKLRSGDSLELLNGRGIVLKGTLDQVRKEKITLWIESLFSMSPLLPKISLLQGVSKNQKASWLIQKATELGVHRIIFFHSSSLAQKANLSDGERWKKIAMEALRQSGNPFLPEIVPPALLGAQIRLVEAGSACLFLDEQEPKNWLGNWIQSNSFLSVCVAVGPEEGWSKEHRSLLREKGFVSVRLGSFVLRTETAGLAAMAAFRLSPPLSAL